MNSSWFLKKYYRQLIFTMTLLFFVLMIGVSHCFEEWEGERSCYQGIVTMKYRDSTSHNFRTIVINDKEKIYLTDFGEFEQYVFEKISVGDSVSKVRGDNKLYLYSVLGDTAFTIDFGCDKNWFRWDRIVNLTIN